MFCYYKTDRSMFIFVVWFVFTHKTNSWTLLSINVLFCHTHWSINISIVVLLNLIKYFCHFPSAFPSTANPKHCPLSSNISFLRISCSSNCFFLVRLKKMLCSATVLDSFLTALLQQFPFYFLPCLAKNVKLLLQTLKVAHLPKPIVCVCETCTLLA